MTPTERTRMLERLACIVGAANVLSTPDDMAGYLVSARRASGTAFAVIRPANTGEVAAVVSLARAFALPITPQGGNTGLSDGATPQDGRTVVVSLSRMNRVLQVDPVGFTLTVEAGVVLANAQACAQAHGLMLPISLGAEGSCQIGGNIATNAGGRSVLRYGMTRQSVLGLQVVLADGTIWEGLSALRKDNSGYDLKQLFIGSEGTLGIITAAVLQLVPAPTVTATAFVAVASPTQALHLLSRLRAGSGDCISSFELMNRYSMEVPIRHLPGATNPFETMPAWCVLTELQSSRPNDNLTDLLEGLLTQAIEDGVATDAVLAQSLAQAASFWRLRDEGTAWYWKEGGFLLHDPSVPLPRIPDFVELVEARVNELMPGVRISAFGHVGDGNIHIIVSQPAGVPKAAFLARKAEIQAAVYAIATSLEGSFSAEHGVGRLKVEQLAQSAVGAKLELLRAVKATMDPDGVMNPGAILGR